MTINALVTNVRDTGFTFAIILAGVPLYWLWTRSRQPTGAGGFI
jgi:hypothetical protein